MKKILWLIGIIPLAAFVQYPTGQESYKLIPKFEINKKVRVQTELSVDLDVTMATRRQGESTQTLLIRRQEEFVQEATAVQDNLPSSLSVTCARSILDRQGTRVDVPGTQVTPLQGKSFNLKRVQDSYQVENPSAELDPALTASLGKWMNFAHLLPADAKKVEEFWSVNPGSIVSLLEGAMPVNVKGEMVCKLVKVADGRAELSLSGNLKKEAQGKKDSQSQLDLTGSMVFDVNRGQILSVRLTGDFKLVSPIADEKSDQGEDLGSVTFKSRKLEFTATFTSVD